MFVYKEYDNNLENNIKQLINEFNQFSSIEDDNISIFANSANHLKSYFKNEINWVGFYLVDESNNLYLGPFNGLPAVTRIENKKGVCGTCLDIKKTIVVDDVCNSDNHITCDINSKSEICIPVIIDGSMIALLDIDSPNIAYFSKYKILLEKYIEHISKYIN